MNTFVSGSTLLAGGVILVLVLGAGVGLASRGIASGSKVLTDALSQPLNGAASVAVELNAGTGNMTVDRLSSGEPLLASGSLEYMEKQAPPSVTRSAANGQETLRVTAEKSGGLTKFRFPWEACNGATNWQVHLNPAVATQLNARSGGGNLNLDLAGTAIREVAANTGGGNVELVLPENAANLNVTAQTGGGNVTVVVGNELTGSSTLLAKSGAGNVSVQVPAGTAVRVHASSGMGKLIIDPSLTQLDKGTYETPGYAQAADKIEITVSSGAGNVSVTTK